MKTIIRSNKKMLAYLLMVAFALTLVTPLFGESVLATTTADSTYVHNFTADGITSSFFEITGNLSSTKGTVSYNGETLSTCLKIETSTSIDFTVDGDAELTLVFNADNSSNIKVDGEKYTLTDGILNMSLGEGSHTISKADTAYLYYMVVTVSGGEATTTPESTTEPSDTPASGDIYVSPSGTASAAGTESDPMDLVTAIGAVEAGNTIWMLAGTYEVYDTYGSSIVIDSDNSGTSGAYKTISSINGGEVIIDFSGMEEDSSNRGIVLDGSYWHFYDVDICNAGDNGMLLSGDNNVIELCQFYNNHDSGLQLSRYDTSADSIDLWPTDNQIINCTAYNNKDEETSENADGFAAKLTCGEGNVFDGCIAYCNSDDGWDLYAKPETGSIGVVTIRNCVAFGNGKLTTAEGSANGDMNGFKLGGSSGECPTPHVVQNCLAFNNGATGFTDNGNGGAIVMTNCTAVNNGQYDSDKANYMCYRTSSDAQYTNLVSFMDSDSGGTDQFLGEVKTSIYHYKDAGYYWVNSSTFSGSKVKYTGSEANDYTISASDFVSTSIPGYNASEGTYATNYHTVLRNSAGEIDLNGLFEISSSSALYSAGTDSGCVGVAIN